MNDAAFETALIDGLGSCLKADIHLSRCQAYRGLGRHSFLASAQLVAAIDCARIARENLDRAATLLAGRKGGRA